ncbi:MAG: LysE family translocator [Flavobacteriales bacterium]
MTADYLLKGIVLGISVAAPVGPIGVLCIKRSLTEGRRSGLVTGMGATVADTIYGAIAAFGLTFVTDFLLEHEFFVRIFGGLFLIVMGVRLFTAKPPADVVMEKGNMWHHFMSTILLTASNPATVLFFLAAFAGLGMETGKDTTLSLMIVLGVLIGSAVWWLSLSYFVSIFRSKIKIQKLIGLNKISGSFIIACGLYALVSAILH